MLTTSPSSSPKTLSRPTAHALKVSDSLAVREGMRTDVGPKIPFTELTLCLPNTRPFFHPYYIQLPTRFRPTSVPSCARGSVRGRATCRMSHGDQLDSQHTKLDRLLPSFNMQQSISFQIAIEVGSSTHVMWASQLLRPE
jgi:hypothetical protein